MRGHDARWTRHGSLTSRRKTSRLRPTGRDGDLFRTDSCDYWRLTPTEHAFEVVVDEYGILRHAVIKKAPEMRRR